MLNLVNISKSFGRQTPSGPLRSVAQNSVLDKVNLVIRQGEFFSLLGPSGCGKTTLLRIIAGLETATSGEILLDGKRVDTLSPQERPFNMVFQRYALFPHLSVAGNIAFGLKMKNQTGSEIQQKIEKALHIVEMPGFANRKPETLSGGQQQRIAIARAIVNEPKILLLDEPLSALDLKMREHMQTELRLLQKKLGITFIFVTHDQEEALTLSDRIGIMNKGNLEQVSTPKEIYRRPQTHFAAHFVGKVSSIKGTLLEKRGDLLAIQIQQNQVIVGRPHGGTENLKVGMEMEALIRPERVKLNNGKDAGSDNCVDGILVNQVFRGDQLEAHVNLPDNSQFTVVMDGGTPDDLFTVGSLIRLKFSPEDTLIFGKDE